MNRAQQVLWDIVLQHASQWVNDLLVVWQGASIVVVLAIFVYHVVQAWQRRNQSIDFGKGGRSILQLLAQRQQHSEKVVVHVSLDFGEAMDPINFQRVLDGSGESVPPTVNVRVVVVQFNHDGKAK